MDSQIPNRSLISSQSLGRIPKFIMPTAVAALIVFAVIGYYFYNSSKNNLNNSTLSTMQSSAPATSTKESSGEYKNGTYAVKGNYVSPGGPREVGVSLTLADGIITEASTQVLAEDATSVKFQKEFIGSFKPMVIGKNIDEVILSKVAGSSLTPKGFNDAVEKIKVEAKS